MIDRNNKYTLMQKDWYEKENKEMSKENHRFHDNNPDYWSYLLFDLTSSDQSWSDRKIFEFGCGCGRNIINLHQSVACKSIDGCDISALNIESCEKALVGKNSNLFVSSGIDCGDSASNEYDFAFSTIVLQHICVNEIRLSILKDIYRILKTGGIFSFQMGYDGPDAQSLIKELPVYPENIRKEKYTNVLYHSNFYDAISTNSHYDTMVENTDFLLKDLESIGFKSVKFTVRRPWCDDKHPAWLYVRCEK